MDLCSVSLATRHKQKIQPMINYKSNKEEVGLLIQRNVDILSNGARSVEVGSGSGIKQKLWKAWARAGVLFRFILSKPYPPSLTLYQLMYLIVSFLKEVWKTSLINLSSDPGSSLCGVGPGKFYPV